MIYTLKEYLVIRDTINGLVFTNGCFDIIHRGHVEYLNQAKSLGKSLIIGVNSDASVRRIKGEGRPINNESDRAFVLSNLKCVDAVIIFDEDTPYNLINALKPDFLVKGGDWKEEQIVGSDIVKSYDGKVYSLKYVDSYSTTNIIDKIKKD
ncbi:MAG: D-glycero-beta-D-manno-heptose 1-phosphate adenylyltransferase [Candidatus Kapaibacterium sp.]